MAPAARPGADARHGDPAAKKRFASATGKLRRNGTGSRTGFVGNLAVAPRGAGTDLFGSLGGVDLSEMYERSRTHPDRCCAVEDPVWREGGVQVGGPEKVAIPPPAAEGAP